MLGDDVDYTKVMFGCHAMHFPTQLVLQDAGRTPDGRYMVAVVGLLTSDQPILSEAAREKGCPHELIVGDVVIRPRGKWASTHFRGSGLTGLVTSNAMFPDGHEFQTLNNGFQPQPPK